MCYIKGGGIQNKENSFLGKALGNVCISEYHDILVLGWFWKVSLHLWLYLSCSQ